ncbi:tRNA(Ile)-lysidine synthase [Prevotella herbatica]|uniref:tRNA(Ile)-lysidine synthase n=1 Tax=Prevotella herbatica TaxID=2801997 RepID=A0ABN6EKN4_9BACT|nr:tRNA lysidine(34) synthetase TilS [Prevotella herbatica]BCS86505.1 tRNA(Ile)-lysidine synthase [Prevotella herbatica]
MLNKFALRVKRYVEINHLLSANGRYLVALSGGSDSVALLRVMIDLGYCVEAMHCNFHLRGEESDRDEKFCENLCNEQNVPFHRVHFDTKSYASLHKVSIEMAARELRYDYFEKLRKDLSADAILVAHHRDDSVETLLINLIRGTGLHGLQGISSRNGYIIRPLLDVSRNDIIDYLNSIQQNYVTDSSNNVDDVTRNKIRLNIIPLLNQINPSASADIAKTANRIRQAACIFDEAIKKCIDEVVVKKTSSCTYIDIDRLKSMISSEYVLYSIIHDYSFTPSQIEQISENLDAPSGKIWTSKSHNLLIDRGMIIINSINVDDNQNKIMKIPETGNYYYNENLEFRFSVSEIDSDFKPSKISEVVTLDADKVNFPLVIRHIKNADRFVPFGMNGSKLLSDFLTDNKLTLFDKQKQLVIEDNEGNIVWVVGLRTDNRFKIIKGSSHCLKIEMRRHI